jgi:hypothetical protein
MTFIMVSILLLLLFCYNNNRTLTLRKFIRKQKYRVINLTIEQHRAVMSIFANLTHFLTLRIEHRAVMSIFANLTHFLLLYIYIYLWNSMQNVFRTSWIEHTKPRAEPCIFELQLLKCCWHPNFPLLRAHSNIGGVEHLPRTNLC